MSDVITVQVTGDHSFAGEDGRLSWKGRLFSWDFTPKTPVEMSPEEVHSLYTYKGPSRVLEIGCGDGEWCFRVKEEHQDWIVEGLDDADHWTKKHHGVKIR
jgi:tRNA G46 methylase TrmB